MFSKFTINIIYAFVNLIYVVDMVSLCLAMIFAEVVEKEEVEDFEKLAKDLENASPLEITDKALDKFGNDIAIAFRYYSFSPGLV